MGVCAIRWITSISLPMSAALAKAEALYVAVDLDSLSMGRFSYLPSGFQNVDDSTGLPPLAFPLRIYNGT